MSRTEHEAVLAIGLFAALADGEPSESERARLKSALAGLAPSEEVDVARVYEQVLLRKTTVQAEAAAIKSSELRRVAFESAVAICDADDTTHPPERAFLDQLAASLSIPPADADAIIRQAERLSLADLVSPPAATVAATEAPTTSAGPSAAEQRAEQSIQNYAMLCGAIELLPQSLASMAVIPLQMKMVYGIGKEFGYSLDRGHIKDFIATVGVGATSQIVEGYARRLLGGLIGKAGKAVLGKKVGGIVGSIGTTAVGAGMTFATTYALGRVARQYYAGGRKFGAIDLQSIFKSEVASAQARYQQLAPQIQAQAARLNPAELLRSIGG